MLSVTLTKRFPGFTLDVSWEADDRIVALFGPSGAGKSLTLGCLAGLVRPDTGRIVVNGRTFDDVAGGVHLPPQARRLGYVFQGYALFPHLTVAENVAFGLRDRPRAERRRRAGEVLERLGLGEVADRHPRELSGGQQQRVALGRALAPDPELLLLDEPLSALDAPLRRQLRDELGRPDHRRLTEIESGRWWLAGRDDRDAAAVPLADRVEWSVFSLLSTAGPLSEAAFYERIAGLFSGPDLPDETLVRACLESYRSRASTADRLLTGDDLLRRSVEHGELLALLADVGHGMGFSVWLGLRQQERRVGGRPLGDRLSERERRAFLPLVSRAPAEVLEEVDCIWYVRGRATILFEVEWTAMLSDAVLGRHTRIPTDERTVRFLVIVPERAELVRHKIERSPVLRAALEAGNWHLLKANHLRTFAAADPASLAELEPYLGLDPRAERTGEQLALFGR